MSKKQANNSDFECRSFSTEIRAKTEDDKVVVRGYAAKFDSLSENLGGFREIIKPGAFDEVLQNDVRALLNHDPDKILGRTKNGTLRIGVDEVGLYYEYDDPGTSYSRDLLRSLERGDVDQSSFQFIVDTDDWTEDQEGRYIRSIVKVRTLLDVSPVVFPAYQNTSVAKRNLEQIQKETKQDNTWQIEAEARQRLLTIKHKGTC